ncbi:MAG: hypothetical protein H6730_05570 [Deltaproteobacteria bacterium]|nr:hypothetical protein [Deltaproteobacteria bacterium]
MRAAAVLTGLLVVLAAGRAEAEAPPPAPEVPWALTGTASQPLSDPAPDHRVEHRRFVKQGRGVVRAGFSYLSRGDLYTNPGVALEGTWYPFEWLGVDLAGTVFFSRLGSTAANLRTQTGLLPDAQRLRGRAAVGGRFAFAYGKLLVEALDTVVHMDANLHLHLGVMITERTANFAGDAGLSVQVMAYERALVWADASWVMGYEDRKEGDFMGGLMGTLGVGWRL